MKQICILVILLIILVFSCDDLLDPYAATGDRPAIPVPETYTGEVPEKSEEMVIETADASQLNFNPDVRTIWDGGTQIYSGTTEMRLLMLDEGEVVPNPGGGSYGAGLDSIPRLQFIRYWVLIDGPTPYTGGTTTTVTQTTTTSVSETFTYSFTETISIEAQAEVSLFVDASVTASASFSATQEFSSTETTETSLSHSFSVSAQPGKDVLYTVWQLYEELRYVDEDGELFTDPDYTFLEFSLRYVFPTDEIVPVTSYYDS